MGLLLAVLFVVLVLFFTTTETAGYLTLLRFGFYDNRDYGDNV